MPKTPEPWSLARELSSIRGAEVDEIWEVDTVWDRGALRGGRASRVADQRTFKYSWGATSIRVGLKFAEDPQFLSTCFAKVT